MSNWNATLLLLPLFLCGGPGRCTVLAVSMWSFSHRAPGSSGGVRRDPRGLPERTLRDAGLGPPLHGGEVTGSGSQLESVGHHQDVGTVSNHASPSLRLFLSSVPGVVAPVAGAGSAS